MFISDEEIRDVHKLDKKDKELAKAFIKGAVYSWLNSHGETVFAIRDLFGKDNTDWTGTPLECIWHKNKNAGKNDEEAYEQSAKDAGWLLKAVLSEDTIRRFRVTKHGLSNGYSWVK